MEGQRDKKQGTQTNAQEKTKAAERVSAPVKATTPVNEKLADLLFDLQSDDSPDHALQTAPEKVKQEVKEVVEEKKVETPKLLGILGRCAIEGCDVHTLSDSGNYLNHFTPSEALSGQFAKARMALQQCDSSTIGILVYNDHLETVSLDGTVKGVS